ncbi:PREDICTED: uncharacterized protein LOC108575432 [Habropoda laboriosa]|uniref:uncharacterized protein LOC108575432 n=1 Tax=Habropoda laboriosa TaxID=597456 RepID=UPI00083D049C|nr:PREDICTED: uncharacterized protein LOC108575432 [Habropoda laboriosa]
MANKTTSNPKSQEQSMKIAVQSQLAKIKKEEEEELWISGEELYTEGSSDEEEYKTQSRSRRKVNSNQPSRTFIANPSAERRGYSPTSAEIKMKSIRSKDSINENQSLPKNASKHDKMPFNNLSRSSSIESQRTERLSAMESSTYSMTKDSSEFSTVDDQMENTEISWKAKRGTLLLPNSSNDDKKDMNKC